ARSAGLSVDSVAPQIAFFFNAHNDFLEEIAKFRAARRLWAKITREQFEASDPRSWLMRFHTQTAGSTLTAQQPSNNVVRVALQALAAVLGGTQSLHTNSMDEALGLPTEEAVRIALRSQQIIAHESGVANTVDPVAGSYAIENLTETIEDEAMQYLDRIAEMGGALRAIDAGFVQREIHEAAYETQKKIEAGEQVVVGVNAYRSDVQVKLETLKVDPAIEHRQRKRLQDLRQSRNADDVEAQLGEIEEAASTDANLMPHFITAVESGATLGEICDRLRGVWGEYRPPSTL
ncbi:MAG: methylmalonyl-CoA mutase family protein, partial [Anaerolineales bacterium]